MNNFYSVMDEEDLDKQNKVLNHMTRATNNMRAQNNQSLSTVGACSNQINNVLMGQHEKWIQNRFSKIV